MSLQVWLPLKGDLENLGLANIDVDVMGSIPFSAGKIGSAATFSDSSANCINFDGLEQIDNFSWTCWVKVVAGATHIMYILSEGRDCGYTGVSLWISNANALYFRYGGNNNGVNRLLGTLESDVWYHVAIIVSSDGCKGYLNGALVNTWGYVKPDYTQSQGKFVIGKMSYNYTNTSNYFPFKGQINDVRIYDHCLSAKEVKLISQALVCHYPLNDFVGGENLIKGTSPEELSFTIPSTGISDRFTAKTVEVPSGTTYTLSFLAKADVDGAVLRTHYYNPNTTTTCVSSQGRTKTANDGNMDFILTTKWEHYWVRYSQSSTTAIKTIICPRLMGTDYISTQKSGKIYWKMVKFEKGSVATPWVPNASDALYSAMGFDGVTVHDCSGYENNGVMAPSGVYADSESARYSSCVRLDKGSATSGYIDAGTGGKVTDEITVSTWMYMDTWTTNQHPFSCTEGGGWNIENQSSMPSFPVYVRTVGYKYAFKSGITPKWTDLASGWHLFTGTYDGYTVTLYIDGQPAGSTGTGKTDKLPIQYHTSNHIYLHSEATGSGPSGSYDACKMSDFRIYATALSADDVKELYETSASVDNHGNMYAYEFNEL